jgi:hypothetical protein
VPVDPYRRVVLNQAAARRDRHVSRLARDRE